MFLALMASTRPTIWQIFQNCRLISNFEIIKNIYICGSNDDI